MQQFVTITSQGQITIPAAMRRAISISENNKAAVSVEKNRIIIEPVADLAALGGILKNKALKEKNINKIIELEEETVTKMVR